MISKPIAKIATSALPGFHPVDRLTITRYMSNRDRAVPRLPQYEVFFAGRKPAT